MTVTVTKRERPAAPGALPDGLRGRRRERALAPWGVVAIWAGLLGILVATSAGFGSNTLVLEVSGSSAGFVALLAGAVWLDRRLRPRRGYLRYPVSVGGTALITVTAMVAWLGLAFGEWLVIIAAVPLTAAAGLEISARRHARQETRATAAALAAPAGARGYAPEDGNGSAASASESREPGLAGSR